MTKFKLFTFRHTISSIEEEEAINKWIDEHPDYYIRDFKITSDSSGYLNRFIILYEEPDNDLVYDLPPFQIISCMEEEQ